jgi:hypothetical protein
MKRKSAVGTDVPLAAAPPTGSPTSCQMRLAGQLLNNRSRATELTAAPQGEEWLLHCVWRYGE